jgi:predicted RNase H-like HicB family nuclease
MHHCAIIVFWSDEDGAWTADIPAPKLCSPFRDTPQKAVAQVQVTMEAWPASARQSGHPVPVPRFQPRPQAAE